MMLTSLALIFLLGMFLSGIFKKLKLPGLIGMLIAGIIIGPHALNLLDSSLLGISSDLRTLALVMILLRAGLSLDINDLKKVGRPAILMCFIPATLEMAGMILLAPRLLGISVLDAAIMGTVVAAVSPAVVVPKMLFLKEHRYGTDKSIPQLLTAGASVDDIYLIVMFTAFIGLAQGTQIGPTSFLPIPISIVSGLFIGIASGVILSIVFSKFKFSDSAEVLIILSIAFLFVALQNNTPVPFSGLLASMGMGGAIQRQRTKIAQRLSTKFSKLWVGAEILLFVLVGATVDLSYVGAAGAVVVVVILGALAFRMLGVFGCLTKTKLVMKERLFCMMAYIPKGTVQAAIGSIPLSLGLSCGNIVLTIAVLAIIITAPLGAICIDLSYEKLLNHEPSPSPSPKLQE